MNDLTTFEATGAMTSPAAVMLNPTSMNALVAFADMMSKSAITVPQHLQGKPADCLAIAMQAAQWGMNPFAVAQKTHVVSGRLGYEAQLVNAVITSSRAIDGTFRYEFRGTGHDLECRVGATPRGEAEIVWGEWLRNGDVKTRNSPLWQVNPKQQLGYLQVKNWARLYCPGAILGVYTDDELAPSDPSAEHATPRGPKRRSAAASESAPPPMVDEVPLSERKMSAPTQAPAVEPPAAPPKPPATATTGGIAGGQVAYLRNKLKSAGVDEASVCDRFQVTGIELLSVEQFDTVKAELLAMA